MNFTIILLVAGHGIMVKGVQWYVLNEFDKIKK